MLVGKSLTLHVVGEEFGLRFSHSLNCLLKGLCCQLGVGHAFNERGVLNVPWDCIEQKNRVVRAKHMPWKVVINLNYIT